MSTQRNETLTVTLPNIDPAALQVLLAQVAAQQAAQPTVPGTNLPVTPAAPIQAAVPVSVSDAIDNANRPKGYGPALWSAKNRKPGTSIPFTVAGPTAARQAVNYTTKQPEFYQNDPNRPKPELVIPLDVPVSEQHPEGRATLYSKGNLTQKISQAMAAAGAPQEVIKLGLEVGATGSITFNGLVTRQGKQATYTENDFTVVYVRPGQAPTPAPAAVQAPAAAPSTPDASQGGQPAAAPFDLATATPEQLMAHLTSLQQKPAA